VLAGTSDKNFLAAASLSVAQPDSNTWSIAAILRQSVGVGNSYGLMLNGLGWHGCVPIDRVVR
jgi:hypothetical protein